ncbi:MAG: hypothetical protein AB7E80_04205 [Hyphomicrobiaceae bacterium]
MLQRIEDLAYFSVARGCGFAMLAIATTMIGLSFDAPQSLQTGAVLSLLTCVVLLIKALRTTIKPYHATEVWLMLAPADRPPDAIAQRLIARSLREAYLRFALYFAYGALLLIGLRILIALAV